MSEVGGLCTAQLNKVRMRLCRLLEAGATVDAVSNQGHDLNWIWASHFEMPPSKHVILSCCLIVLIRFFLGISCRSILCVACFMKA